VAGERKGSPAPFSKASKLATKRLHLRAPAKINLVLRVLGRRADGYHDLHSWVAKLALGDGLTTEVGGRGFSLRVPAVPSLETDENSVLVAARAFHRAFGAPSGARFVLHKHTPVTAGLGGGSSDAATTLRALSKLTGRGSAAELSRLGAEIGSDVPLFLLPGPIILEGRGERVRAATPLPPLWALLVKPELEIRAAEAYRLLDATRRPSALTGVGAGATSIGGAGDPLTEIADPGAVGEMLVNDLQRGCVKRFPAVRRVLRGLDSLGSLGCAMSGSGSTCFALFPSAASAERARRQLERSRYRVAGDWTAVSALRRGGGRLAG
jgi:4-diphosphocytidyl-2-C-methyl-D-erythritol kinase